MSVIHRAIDFLNMHGGSCSVLEESIFGRAFRLLEQSGEVKIRNSNTPGYIDIYSLDFQPKFNGGNH